MVEMRKMGQAIQKHANANGRNQASLAITLGCTEAQIIDLYSGRFFLSLEQVEKLAGDLNVDPMVFFELDDEYYNQNVVHCMTPFTKAENREKMLDYIDIYIDAYNAQSK